MQHKFSDQISHDMWAWCTRNTVLQLQLNMFEICYVRSLFMIKQFRMSKSNFGPTFFAMYFLQTALWLYYTHRTTKRFSQVTHEKNKIQFTAKKKQEKKLPSASFLHWAIRFISQLFRWTCHGWRGAVCEHWSEWRQHLQRLQAGDRYRDLIFLPRLLWSQHWR